MITKFTTKEEMIRLSPPCKCAKCEHGCTMGSGFFADEPLSDVAVFLGISERELKERFLEEVELFHTRRWRPRSKKPFGHCIFYQKSIGCTIHPTKPLECKIATGCKPHGEEASQWFRINYFVNPGDEISLREYVIAKTHNKSTIPGGSLQELVPEKKKREQILQGEQRWKSKKSM